MSTERALSRAALYAARPTLLLDGRRSPLADELLLSAQVNEQREGPAWAELRFANVSRSSERGIGWAFETEEESPIGLGTALVLSMGDESDPREIFQGTVSGLEAVFGPEHPPELIVLAEDPLQKARMKRRTRTHSETTLGDLVESLAAEMGLRARVSHLDHPVGTQVQINETDLGFLRRLLERHDAWMRVSGGELHAAPWGEGEGSGEEITLELHSQLKRVRLLADLAHQVSTISYSGWDAAQGEAIRVESDGSLPLGPGSGRTGRQMLEEAFGPRTEHAGAFLARDEREARALVQAVHLERARRFVLVEGCTQGHPDLRVGSRVRIVGVGPRFENTYTVTRACHRFDPQNGYETDFEAEGAYFGG